MEEQCEKKGMLLGRGEWGKVVVEDASHVRKIWFKCKCVGLCKNSECRTEEETVDGAIREMCYLKYFGDSKSKYVITGSDPRFDQEYGPNIILPRASGSLSKAQKCTPEAIRTVMFSVCRGLSELTRMRYIHGDLKPGNVLVMKDRSVKLGDLGSVTRFYSTEVITSPRYMPPEGGKYPMPSYDMWGLGCIMYGMKTGDYYGEDVNQFWDFHQRGEKYQEVCNLFAEGRERDFFVGITRMDPMARLTPQLALNHKYLSHMHEKYPHVLPTERTVMENTWDVFVNNRDALARDRMKLFEWIKRMQNEIEASRQTFFNCVYIIDRFIGLLTVDDDVLDYSLVGMCCFYVSCLLCDYSNHISLEWAASVFKGRYTEGYIQNEIIHVLQVSSGELFYPCTWLGGIVDGVEYERMCLMYSTKMTLVSDPNAREALWNTMRNMAKKWEMFDQSLLVCEEGVRWYNSLCG